MKTAEDQRLDADRKGEAGWKRWGPYLSERQWGTVREDYSPHGTAWDYFPHDHARSRAYRWGEDGLAGVSDDKQHLCFALALWNGRDPILKERLFGLTNSEGNHGEDVKEYYFYLDNTPTHAYMKYLYKYPQAAFPYADMAETNRRRSAEEFEYELLDTGIFAEDRYFDVFVEYAKESPDDVLVLISAVNRGPETATLAILPTLWFRNTWSWGRDSARPNLRLADGHNTMVVEANHADLGTRYLYAAGEARLLFTENETNLRRIFDSANPTPYVKDGIHEAIVHGNTAAVNPAQTGTKMAIYYSLSIAPGATGQVRLRLSAISPDQTGSVYPAGDPFGAHFDDIFQSRKQEADEFYAGITPNDLTEDAAQIMRQALAGMLWTKQYYYYDVAEWLHEHGIKNLAGLVDSPVRNKDWYHMVNDDVISMPDKWEYPWYAVWDLAFHTVPLAMVDIDFAKEQLALMLRETYLHPNGQIPAYEWNFGDVNPPVHAWAVNQVYLIEKERTGSGDLDFLKDSFHKLMLNFTWWVNRKDPSGLNVFEGGFLGLDNIGVFDRSAPLPTGGHLEQADGTAWMAFYALTMLQIALEIADQDPAYQGMAYKYLEHFLWIRATMHRIGEHADELWDEEDGFFYDVLRFPDGNAVRLKVRSLVGLLSVAACAVIEPEMVTDLPEFMKRLEWFAANRPELTRGLATVSQPGVDNRRLLSVLDETNLRRVLARMLDEDEFLSSHGIRSISRHHLEHPYVFEAGGTDYNVTYMPAESTSGMFGGNSNWRGPIWLPMNFILVRGLIMLHAYYGDSFTVEYPTGSGRHLTLWQVSEEIAGRIAKIFLRDATGRRPVYGGVEKFQNDPHWRDYILFHEYFHGDNGAGLGASHQTGWTGLVARLLQFFPSVQDFERDFRDADALAAKRR